MRAITLYTTDHCQLCEQAMDWLLALPSLQGLQLQVIDVALDEQLFDRYGKLIPVLEVAGQVLQWPFSEAAIEALMASPAAAPR